MHAADTQEIREVSTPGGFPPATSNIYDQSQDVIKRGEREEGEWAEEVTTAVAVSVLKENEEVEDVVSVESRRLSQSSDRYDVGDQDNDPQDAQRAKQRDELTVDEEDMRGNAEKTENVFGETQPEESADDQDYNSGKPDDVRHRRPQEVLEGDDRHNMSYNDQRYKQEVRNMHARYDNPQQVCVEMQKDEENLVCLQRDRNRKMEQSERREEASTKYFDRDADAHDVGQNMYVDQEGKLEIGRDYDLSVDKQGNVDGMEIDVKVDKERKSGADERGNLSGSARLLKIYDLCSDENEGQNIPNNYQRSKRGISSRFYQRHEQQSEGKMDVRDNKEQMRGDGKHTQRKGRSERSERHDVEDQNVGRLDVRQNRAEHVECTTYRDAKQAKEQEKKRDDEYFERRADSQAGLAGSRRQVDSQPKGRAGFNEDTVEGRRGSKQSKTYDVKIVETEIRETSSGVQRSSETKYMRKEGTSRDGFRDWVEYDLKSDPKKDAKATLSEGVGSLHLSESPLPMPQKHRTKRVTGNAKEETETSSTICSNARKMHRVSDAQEQAVGIKHAKKERGKKKRKLWRHFSPLKQDSKEKKKRKTIGCFSMFRKSHKKVDQTSESD